MRIDEGGFVRWCCRGSSALLQNACWPTTAFTPDIRAAELTCSNQACGELTWRRIPAPATRCRCCLAEAATSGSGQVWHEQLATASAESRPLARCRAGWGGGGGVCIATGGPCPIPAPAQFIAQARLFASRVGGDSATSRNLYVLSLLPSPAVKLPS